MNQYFIIYKPYLVLCQFSPEAGKQTLKDYFDVPKDVYPVGRLDADSEGLLLLTNNKQVNHRLLNPVFAHARTYWAQVDGHVQASNIAQLEQGVSINNDGKPYRTKPCKAILLEPAPIVAERTPPIRFRKNIPAPWLQLTLTEGKNRQVRKMTAAIGFPTLRLIRYSIEKLTIDGLSPGMMLQMDERQLFSLIF